MSNIGRVINDVVSKPSGQNVVRRHGKINQVGGGGRYRGDFKVTRRSGGVTVGAGRFKMGTQTISLDAKDLDIDLEALGLAGETDTTLYVYFYAYAFQVIAKITVAFVYEVSATYPQNEERQITIPGASAPEDRWTYPVVCASMVAKGGTKLGSLIQLQYGPALVAGVVS